MRARIVLGLGMALGSSAVGFDYRHWSAVERDRLERGSRVMDTTLGRVEVVDDGDGMPVLMVHGSPGGYDSGPLFARMLGLSGCRIISPSRPGYLRTPASSGRTPGEQADLMVALLDALGVQQAVVVGVSGGGPCALSVAQRHPSRCSHLVMIEAASGHYSEKAMYAALPPLARFGKWVETTAMKSNPPAYLARCVGLTEESGMLAELAHSFARYDLRRLGYELDMQQFGNLGPMPVDHVTMPTLVIHGTADTDAPADQSRALARRIPQARLVLVPGANHLSLWASPQLSSEVLAFVGA